MKFVFRVNTDYVFLHALNAAQKKEPFEGWKKFANNIWDKTPAIFYFLSGSPEYILFTSSKNTLPAIAKTAEKTLKETRKTKEYKKISIETEEYGLFVRQQWRKNYKQALSILKDITGFLMPPKKVVVYLTHPKLKNGLTISDEIIVWGHHEDYKNYTTVYLCHELMHILTDHNNTDLVHAAIELAIDNELRIRLNKKGRYFEYPCHTYLQEIERKLLPNWKAYLRQEKQDFWAFIKENKTI
ncbi:MAG: Uncharacterized protein CEN88_268 [Candidatus Berkelbacteria bacterium Licking1014_2]|uniref:Uncharacterized protein n=1 Tax=Candidatus Berkelbacteria bacterium Licking1014_2 TaxID=2017146 RepID=A0A554LV74_9BACT|nr:MAG: Uncharacterized protein CEN88_268 [Candidatus Berkelbacteria bacterium Licking1014_2]